MPQQDIYHLVRATMQDWPEPLVPVWPALSMGALHLVPCPPSPLLCVAVVKGGEVQARLLLRDMPCPLVPDALGIGADYAGPLTASVSFLSSSNIRLRHGDLICARPPANYRVPPAMPIHLTPSQARHHALWQLPFVISQTGRVTMWRPGAPARTVDTPVGFTWKPAACCFAGDWVGQGDQWAPVPWIPAPGLHLCLRCPSHLYAHVIFWGVSPTCQRVSIGAMDTLDNSHLVRGVAGMAPSEITLRDGDILEPSVTHAEQSATEVRGRPFWLTVLLGWWALCRARGPPSGWIGTFAALCFLASCWAWLPPHSRPQSQAPPAPRWQGADSDTPVSYACHIWLPSRCHSFDHAFSDTKPLFTQCWSCYLCPRGAPELVWRQSEDQMWEVALTPAGQLQEFLYEYWMAEDLPLDLPQAVHPRLRAAWEVYPKWTCGVPDQLLVATDGSGAGSGAWAFTAWAAFRGSWFRVGWEHGKLNAAGLSNEVPPVLRSYVAELMALQSAALWASVWVDANRAAWGGVPSRVVAAVDNQAALMVAAGHATASSVWARDARVAWQALQSRASTDLVHVPGHQGYVINELADCLAGLAVKGGSCERTPSVLGPLGQTLSAFVACALRDIAY